MVSSFIDISGQRFNNLTAIEVFGKAKSGAIIWKCRCDCGSYIDVVGAFLRNGATKSCGCKNKIRRPAGDLTGMSFGKLTVISLNRNENCTNFWNCICSCGNTSIVKTWALVSGKTSNCYRCGRKTRLPGQHGFTMVFYEYKGSAKRRSLSWNLTKDQVAKLTKEDCHYCGSPPSNIFKTNTYDDHGDYTYNGIDRKDNNVGYEINNCVSCCKLCNVMKMALPEDVFLAHISKIHNHSNK